ncbi:hypothetical protein [Poriferisphaera sp. WC338]|uniref:hypothetical protein n=1 Tax=Poriferisphaera sp. WC338 TaxID=3425129 RepID=UPI003D81A39B
MTGQEPIPGDTPPKQHVDTFDPYDLESGATQHRIESLEDHPRMRFETRKYVGLSFFCLECGYNLRGLTRRTCPECGRSFNPNDRYSYADSPKGNAALVHPILYQVGIPAILFFVPLCFGFFAWLVEPDVSMSIFVFLYPFWIFAISFSIIKWTMAASTFASKLMVLLALAITASLPMFWFNVACGLIVLILFFGVTFVSLLFYEYMASAYQA